MSTDFGLLGAPGTAASAAMQRMNDYRRIRLSPSYQKLRSRDTSLIHHTSLKWLQEEIGRDQGCKQVVISHHAPSSESVDPTLRHDILAAAYASDLTEFIKQSGVDLWIHGHLHTQSDYYIGDTRVLCNPRGYPDEPNKRFVPDLEIDL